MGCVSEEKLIEKYREKIRHNYSPSFYRKSAKLLHDIGLPKLLFDNICVEGVENVRKVEDKQLFYVSNHLSMADFLVQGYVFWKENLPVPRFIAGENLFHFPFGIFWKKCGAISIDRSGNRDYLRIFKEEIQKYLFEGESLLDYAEGGRNYSGNGIKEFKTGLFSSLIDAVEREKDIYVVPMNIRYDKRIEEKFLTKVQENKKKRDESLRKGHKLAAGFYDKIYFGLDVFSYFVRPFDSKKGNAYLKFGESFSAKDFVKALDEKKKFILAEKVRKDISELSG